MSYEQQNIELRVVLPRRVRLFVRRVGHSIKLRVSGHYAEAGTELIVGQPMTMRFNNCEQLVVPILGSEKFFIIVREMGALNTRMRD